jgi:predicted nuclease with TOPRIM domain
MSDIVERLRQCDENVDLVQVAADEIERLREERSQTDDQLAKARLKIEQQANRIDQLEAEVALLREALKPIKRP